ncbi:DUF1202 family protein [Klebsiella quasipneumoniae]
MKEAWKTLTVLMIASPCYVLADANTPTDDVVKKQFAEQTGGIMRLQSVTLKQLDARGNQATYMLEGDMAAAEDLYICVGVAGDYFFMSESGPGAAGKILRHDDRGRDQRLRLADRILFAANGGEEGRENLEGNRRG